MEFLSLIANGATAVVKVGSFLSKQKTSRRVASGVLKLSASMAILIETESILEKAERDSLLERYDLCVLFVL
jgi:hypothetical protein